MSVAAWWIVHALCLVAIVWSMLATVDANT